jgi:hypothetical protein
MERRDTYDNADQHLVIKRIVDGNVLDDELLVDSRENNGLSLSRHGGKGLTLLNCCQTFSTVRIII